MQLAAIGASCLLARTAPASSCLKCDDDGTVARASLVGPLPEFLEIVVVRPAYPVGVAKLGNCIGRALYSAGSLATGYFRSGHAGVLHSTSEDTSNAR
jgi:hypothetical protein